MIVGYVTNILTPLLYISVQCEQIVIYGEKKNLNCSQSSGTFIGALYACKIFFLFFSSITVQKIKAISWWFMVLIKSARYQDIPSHRHQHDEVYSPGSSFIENERGSNNVADNSGEKKMYCRFKKSIKKKKNKAQQYTQNASFLPFLATNLTFRAHSFRINLVLSVVKHIIPWRRRSV